MKHPQGSSVDSLVVELVHDAASLGLAIGEEDAAILVKHLKWVLETSRTHNLTAVSDIHIALRIHVVDSLGALPEVLCAPGGRMLDIGTGGGFPGVPLAVCSMRDAVLLDSVAKKARLLAEYLDVASLKISTVSKRAEEYARDVPGSFAVVVARAVSQLPSLVELASPLLQEGGCLIALKGAISQEELEAGDLTAAAAGMEQLSVRRIELPGGAGTRAIVSYVKRGPSRIPLPRRVGLAQKRPIS